METPTTVKITSDGSIFGDVLASLFIELGYNITASSLGSYSVIDHTFNIKTDDFHSEFLLSQANVVLHISNELYVFCHDVNTSNGSVDSMRNICLFIVGIWGRIRGNRYPYTSKIIDLGSQKNDLRVL